MRTHIVQTLNGYGPFSISGAHSSVVCRWVRNVAVFDLMGPLAEGWSANVLHCKVEELLDEGVKNFAINLAELASADSYTLGILADAYNLVRRAKGRIKFFAASERLVSTLKKLHLDTVFDVFKDEASALSSFH